VFWPDWTYAFAVDDEADRSGTVSYSLALSEEERTRYRRMAVEAAVNLFKPNDGRRGSAALRRGTAWVPI